MLCWSQPGLSQRTWCLKSCTKEPAMKSLVVLLIALSGFAGTLAWAV
jgi:hypothetical protein